MVVEVTFNGGAGDLVKGERGGVQCLMHELESGVQWFNDFGHRYEPMDEILGYPDILRPEVALDIIEQFGLFYNIPGIFREDFEELRGNKTERRTMEFVFTHGHIDHVDGLHYLSADHVIWTLKELQTMLGINQQTRGRTAFQYVYMFDQSTQVPSLAGGTKYLTGNPVMIRRNFQFFKEEEPFLIGGRVPTTAYLLDHSYPFTVGLYHDIAGGIGWSADIRDSGRHPERTKHFFDALVEREAKYLFMEGSLLEIEHGGTEADISTVVAGLIQNKAFAVYAAPPNDFERLTSMYEAACATARTLVVTPAQAFALLVLNGADGYPTLDKVAVYFGNKRNRADWEKGLRQCKLIKEVTAKEMSENQDKFLVSCNSPNALLHLLNAVRPNDLVYIRSHPAPWTLSMFEHERRIRNILIHYGFHHGPYKNLLPPYNETAFHQAHVPGHFNAERAEYYIHRRNWIVIPFHCRSPLEDFIQKVAKGMTVMVPECGRPFYLEG